MSFKCFSGLLQSHVSGLPWGVDASFAKRTSHWSFSPLWTQPESRTNPSTCSKDKTLLIVFCFTEQVWLKQYCMLSPGLQSKQRADELLFVDLYKCWWKWGQLHLNHRRFVINESSYSDAWWRLRRHNVPKNMRFMCRCQIRYSCSTDCQTFLNHIQKCFFSPMGKWLILSQ